MEALRQYALALILGALICGILLSMVRSGVHEALLRLLSGIFLTVTLLSPLGNIRLEPMPDLFRQAIIGGGEQAAAGEEMARQEKCRYISSRIEAYILDKARQRGADLHVSVTLGEDYLPIRVELTGAAEDAVRRELSDILTQELGISKENQLWTG